jgi:hypothetical protein
VRIRSIKPEFWRSSDISKLPIEDRLLFIGLWSYVDDNSVGVDKLAAIAADLFADDLENDARETFARVSRGLLNLSESGRIVRYTVDGTPYLRITNWAKHQRIDKPAKARYPLDDAENATIRESVARGTESFAPGTGEQGNRGTGEQGSVVASQPQPTTRGENGTRIPPNFTASAQMIRWAQDNAPNVNVKLSTQKFKSHYRSVAGKAQFRTDWTAAWEAWLLSDQQRAEDKPQQFKTAAEKNLEAGAKLHQLYTQQDQQQAIEGTL